MSNKFNFFKWNRILLLQMTHYGEHHVKAMQYFTSAHISGSLNKNFESNLKQKNTIQIGVRDVQFEAE